MMYTYGVWSDWPSILFTVLAFALIISGVLGALRAFQVNSGCVFWFGAAISAAISAAGIVTLITVWSPV